MNERRFVIRDVTDIAVYYGPDETITESELKRRLLNILVSIHTTDETDPGWNWRINHLLHGEGKEGENE